jgi:hypothetical protein
MMSMLGEKRRKNSRKDERRGIREHIQMDGESLSSESKWNTNIIQKTNVLPFAVRIRTTLMQKQKERSLLICLGWLLYTYRR